MRSAVYITLLTLVMATPAGAKLPAASEEDKAKAAENLARAAWADKVGAYKLCLSMDRVADAYRKTAAAATAPVATPPCADPGQFVSPVVAATAKPLEASGAHSPPGTAVSPPGTRLPAAGASAAATPATPTKDKPLEASGAHSPSGMAISPPSTAAAESQLSGPGPRK